MKLEKLTHQHVEVQAVLVPLNRPVVSRVGLYTGLAAHSHRPAHP